VAEEFANCPTCGDKIAQGVFKSNFMLPGGKTAAINDHHRLTLEHACEACGISLYHEASAPLMQERSRLRAALAQTIAIVPILSLHSPVGWDYRALGIVTAQSTTGTGLFADVASAWTDAFGMQSGIYNRKIRDGENLCKRSLRLSALEAGGNAIVAVDVDYAEVGASGMLMVCMTGTAIELRNPNIIAEGREDQLNELVRLHQRLVQLDSFGLGEG
jgi:uncharacterized protein YbjQ (UPF0145 family)